MNNEVWKPVIGYEGIYEVSNMGRVKSLGRTARSKCDSARLVPERILRPCANRRGYLNVRLSKNGVEKHLYVHRLVAEAFIPNDNILATTVNHMDEDKTNNCVDNLEWMSQTENNRYSFAGPNGCMWGPKSPCAKSVRCVELDKVFECARDASRWLGLNKQAVAVSIHAGHRCGGYHWEYTDKN